jgi:hypothetical protein
MRIARHNTDDTIELCQSYGQWADETGCPVEFESFLAVDHVDLNSALAETRPLSLAAGRMRDRESVAPALPMATAANHVVETSHQRPRRCAGARLARSSAASEIQRKQFLQTAPPDLVTSGYMDGRSRAAPGGAFAAVP